MFKFNGISSAEMGVIVEEENFMKRAPIIFDKTVINGRNGSMYTDVDTYDDVVSSFTISLLKNNFDEILSWLQGKGFFEYGDREVEMMIYDELELNRKSCIKTATVNYIRRPIWHDANDLFFEVTDYVQNLGNVKSKPILKFSAKPHENFIVTINNITINCTTRENSKIIIDCENMTEVDENGKSVSEQVKLGFEYPCLKVGYNKIVNNNNVKIEIKKRSAYL